MGERPISHTGTKYYPILWREDKTLLNRFESRINRTEKCWLWLGKPDHWGYGSIWVSIHEIKVHRLAWALHTQQDPIGNCVLHHCDNRLCVNPAHLFLGTHIENIEDRHHKGRSRGGALHGESHPNAHLKAEDVLKIRQERKDGVPARQIAKNWGVHFQTVYRICHKQRWAHLEG